NCKKIYILAKDYKLNDDEYLISDLIGATIFDEDEKQVAKIVDFENYGASDIIVLQKGKKEYRVPFLKEFIVKIDAKNKKMVVNNKFYEVLV
ncbi:MAG: PRC-barrel domain-containing protein, partial [Clostridiales bacterium]|nr:PRC-barrel domain-containing protein [Candidatus Apopatousia equi]